MRGNVRNRRYTNGEISVYWRPALCIHSTICFTDLPDVFRVGRIPWVDMEGATTAEIIATVEQCPSGALTYKWNKDIDEETGGW